MGGCAAPSMDSEGRDPQTTPAPAGNPKETETRVAMAGEQDASAELDASTGESDPFGPEDQIWPRVRDGFAMDAHIDQPRVQAFIDWHRCHPDFLERVTARAQPFLYMILEEIEHRGMPSELLLLPVVESAYVAYAYSHGRAAGMWQFIPATGRRFGLKQNWWYDGRRDVLASTNAALDYLTRLHEKFDGDWLLALAAYNAGEGTVRRAVRKNRKLGKPTDFWHLKLPRETTNYVPKLLAVKALVADPSFYNVPLWPAPDEPYLRAVNFDSQIDLAVAAELAEMDVEDVYLLNPGFNRWATDPNGPHRLLFPLDNAAAFEANLAELPAEQRVVWHRHKIRKGETLSEIATRYRTTVSVLKKSNQIRGHTIRAGSYLLVPVAHAPAGDYTLTADARRKARQDNGGSGRKLLHIVQPGDTFWEIARQYNVTIRELAKWNGMAPGDVLHPGDRLVIWVPHVAMEANLRLPDLTRGAPGDTVRKVRYSVRRGDSLSHIARRFSVDVGDIRRWNDIPNAHLLRPGQRLTLYVDITSQGS